MLTAACPTEEGTATLMNVLPMLSIVSPPSGSRVPIPPWEATALVMAGSTETTAAKITHPHVAVRQRGPQLGPVDVGEQADDHPDAHQGQGEHQHAADRHSLELDQLGWLGAGDVGGGVAQLLQQRVEVGSGLADRCVEHGGLEDRHHGLYAIVAEDVVVVPPSSAQIPR